jgi:hypothetical protein
MYGKILDTEAVSFIHTEKLILDDDVMTPEMPVRVENAPACATPFALEPFKSAVWRNVLPVVGTEVVRRCVPELYPAA